MLQRTKDLDRVPVFSQWPEKRGFERAYHDNPEAQAKLVRNLFALAACEVFSSSDSKVISAIEMLIVAFTDKYPTYLAPKYIVNDDTGGGVYEVEPLLLEQVIALVKEQTLKIVPLDIQDFEALYKGNPVAQAHFVENLLGFRAVHSEFGPADDDSTEIVKEIETVINAFSAAFPDYLDKEAGSNPLLIEAATELTREYYAA